MAATILTVGFLGLIQAMATTSMMMDSARRQTVAAQILNNEIEKLRLVPWTTISGLSTTSTPTPIDIDRQLWPTWSNTATYSANSVVAYNGGSYRCTAASSGQPPSDGGDWITVSSSLPTDVFAVSGATFKLTQKTVELVTGTLREITFTVTWEVVTNRRDAAGNPISLKYTRSNSAWYGKYGLNLSYQRS